MKTTTFCPSCEAPFSGDSPTIPEHLYVGDGKRVEDGVKTLARLRAKGKDKPSPCHGSGKLGLNDEEIESLRSDRAEYEKRSKAISDAMIPAIEKTTMFLELACHHTTRDLSTLCQFIEDVGRRDKRSHESLRPLFDALNKAYEVASRIPGATQSELFQRVHEKIKADLGPAP